MAALWRFVDSHLMEKIVLVTLISMIFTRALPEVPASPVEISGAVAAVVSFRAFLDSPLGERAAASNPPYGPSSVSPSSSPLWWRRHNFC